MKRQPFFFTWLSLMILAILSVACGSSTPITPDTAQPDMPNPASVFCQEQGFTLEIREGPQGQYGVCIFSDGSLCDEWAYYRGQCGPVSADIAPTAVIDTRDAALSYVLKTYGDVIPTGDLVWTSTNTSPTDRLGAGGYRFAAGTCVIDITYPIVAPDATVYHVIVADSLRDFRWEGNINAQGTVIAP